MNYIYLTNKSIEQTKKEIETDIIILNDAHVEEFDKIWIINRQDAEENERRILFKAMKA